MPWTIDDVDKHNKKGLTSAQKRRWVEVANSVLDECLSNGGSREDCEVSAIRKANEAVRAYEYSSTTPAYQARTETLLGRQHIVVPIVMMVEGVHAGSHGPLLHTIDELAKFPDAWNGIPVTIGHPTQDGTPVSSNSPDVLEEQVVGRVFNTRMDGNKLRAEAWVCIDDIKRISPGTFEILMDGAPLDVSVGVFTEDDMVQGEWKGERYVGIARNHRPDHLALLPDGMGACSWDDGCGVRVHKHPEVNESGFADEYTGYENGQWRCPTIETFGVNNWNDLDDIDRAFIAAHYLVGSPDAKSFDELAYPVVNPVTGLLNLRAVRAIVTGAHYKDCGVSIPQEVRDAAVAILERAGVGVDDNVGFVDYQLTAYTKGGSDVNTNAGRVKFSGTESTPWSAPNLADFGLDGRWDQLSAADKAKVASHYLIGTADAETFADLKFPVVNPRTGRLNENALRAVISGRGAQVKGVSDEERASARRIAYRLLNEEFDAELKIPENLEASFYRAMKGLATLGYGVSINEMSFADVSAAIQEALDGLDTPTVAHFLVDVYPDYFIYQVKQRTENGAAAGSLVGVGPLVGLYRRGYVIKDGVVEFVGPPTMVRREINYTAMEETVMRNEVNLNPCCPEKVELLIQDEQSPFDESDRSWLLGLNEQQLQKLVPKPVEPPQINKEQALQVLQEHLGDPQRALSLFPEEIREQLSYGLSMYRQHRAEMIDTILANAEGVYEKEELEGMDMKALSKLVRLVRPKANYSPMGHQPQVNDGPVGNVLLPVGVQ